MIMMNLKKILRNINRNSEESLKVEQRLILEMINASLELAQRLASIP